MNLLLLLFFVHYFCFFFSFHFFVLDWILQQWKSQMSMARSLFQRKDRRYRGFPMCWWNSCFQGLLKKKGIIYFAERKNEKKERKWIEFETLRLLKLNNKWIQNKLKINTTIICQTNRHPSREIKSQSTFQQKPWRIQNDKSQSTQKWQLKKQSLFLEQDQPDTPLPKNLDIKDLKVFKEIERKRRNKIKEKKKKKKRNGKKKN